MARANISESQNNPVFKRSSSTLIKKSNFKDWIPEVGIRLSKEKDFNIPKEIPYNKKIYTAICEHGLKTLVDDVLSSKHRSLITPNCIWNSIGKFSKRTPPCATIPSYEKALKRLRETLKVDDKIEPLTIEEASTRIPSRASLGLPYIITHPEFDKNRLMTIYYEKFRIQWERIAAKQIVVFPDCAGIGRGKICNINVNKIHSTWAMPIIIVLQETRFASPLIKAFLDQKCCLNAAYGCEMMKGGMMWLNNEVTTCNRRHGGIKIVIPNYSDFNECVPAWLIRDVFNIVMEKFYLTPDDTIKFKELINYFINTPIRNSDGQRYLKVHGIPYGSMFTDVIGTLVNMVITWCSSEIVFGKYPMFDLYYSDMGLMCYNKNIEVNLQNYAKCLREVFGITMNLDESYWTYDTRKINFFGYFNYNGVPYKDIKDLVAEILFVNVMKDVDDEWEYLVSKSLDCAIASAGCNSVMFEAFKGVVWAAFRMGVDINESVRISRISPRTLRHTLIMGFHDLNISTTHLLDYNLCIPSPICSKFTSGIHLIP